MVAARPNVDHVKSSRGSRLRSDDATLFSGEFWTAKGGAAVHCVRKETVARDLFWWGPSVEKAGV